MKLQIQNYKCFKDQEINFGKITILAGSNSVGKSSVVQSLLLSRTAFELKQGNKLPLNGPFLLELGSSKEILNRQSKSIGNIIFKYTIGDLVSHVTLDIDTEIDEPTIKGCNIAYDSFLGKDTFYYLNAERIGPRMFYNIVSQKFNHAGYKGEATFQLLTKPIEIDSERLLNTDSLLTRQAEYWLEYIIDGARFENASVIGRSKKIEVIINDSLPTNVGFGISYVLPILVNGLIAEKGSMFIVENPEAHLHPAGQSRIGRFLARIAAAGVQVVVETHSEHVINGIRIAVLEDQLNPHDAVINFFQRNKDNHIELIEIGLNSEAELTAFPKGFFDQTQQDLARLIQLKRGKR